MSQLDIISIARAELAMLLFSALLGLWSIRVGDAAILSMVLGGLGASAAATGIRVMSSKAVIWVPLALVGILLHIGAFVKVALHSSPVGGL